MIATKYLIMKPDQTHDTLEVQWPLEPGYDRIAKLVEPILTNRSLEHVAVFADFAGGINYEPLDMFVDDSGLIDGLPRNEAATTIYRRANLMGKSAAKSVIDPEALSYICGTAILFSRRVWF